MKDNTKYKNFNDRAGSVPLSIQNSLLTEFEVLSADFNTDRSKLMKALIRYCINNKENTKFTRELEEILNANK